MDTYSNHTGDLTKINLRVPCEVMQWCAKFHCSKEELEDAANAVGLSPTDIEKYLRTKPHLHFIPHQDYSFNEFIG